MTVFNTSIPLTLYIHIPWCVKKCPYCDFNSHPQRGELPESQYIHRLIEDLEEDLPKIWGRNVQAIFLGGGTPSLFNPEAIDQLLSNIRSRISVAPDAEITLEANPGTVEQQRFCGYRDAGVNRLSIGVQSFNPSHLKKLGRIHDDNEAHRAITAAKNAGFTNFNIDLMFGLPEQTLQQAINDLEQAINYNPPHLSWYQLTLEPNTLFHHQPPPLPDDDAIWEIQKAGQQVLSEHHLNQYEISAYSNNSKECKHNLNYWLFGDYLGIGAGAHSKITNFSEQIVQRFWKQKHPKRYLDSSIPFIAEQKTLNDSDLTLEFMLNALRLKREIPWQLFNERTGLQRHSISKQLDQACKKNLLLTDENNITVTTLGQRYLNNTLACFL